MKSFMRAFLMARSRGTGRCRIVDLVACDPDRSQLVLDPQMRGMGRVGVESLLALELGIKDDVAGVVDATVVQTHFETKQPRYFAAQLLEAGPQEFRRRAAIFLRVACH